MPAPSRPRLAAERLEPRAVPAAWPVQVFTPYVNVALDFSSDYAATARQGDFQFLTLGFVDATAGGQTAWDGIAGAELGSDSDNQVHAAVDALRADGGDVMVSFGGDTEGSDAQELATAVTDPNALQAAYQQVIDAYSLTHVDFDIEGDKMLAQPGSPAAIDRRSQAIAGLQAAATAAGKDLQVYLTLAALGRPDMGQGALLPDSLAVVDSALGHGVKLAGVNLMTMDYADGEVHEMGADATSRASALFGQLKAELLKWGQYTSDAQVWRMIGITPQIGANDDGGAGSEIFTLADARTVASFAAQNGVGRLSYWATGRDQNPNDATGVDETFSGVPQQPFDFAHIFAPFGSQTAPAPAPVSPPPLAVSGLSGGSAVVFPAGPGGQYPATPTATISGVFPGFSGAVRTAVGDVNGDGTPDIILATGPGTPVRVAVVSGADDSTLLVPPFDPFGGNFTGGGFVAAGAFAGSGRADFVVTPDQGGGPRVSIFARNPDGTVATAANFFGIDDPNFRGGARAAVGDVNRDGTPDLVVAAGFGGGPRVALFDGQTVLSGAPHKLTGDFFAFPGLDATNLRNGAYVAVGDVDGDGFGDLIFGGGPGGAPRVFILSGQKVAAGDVAGAQTAPIANFFVAGDSADRGGVRVAATDADGDDRADVAAGSGEGRPGRVRVYLGKDVSGTGEPGTFQDVAVAGGATLTAGVFVG